MKTIKQLLILLFFCQAFFISVFIFSKGFLLTRNSIDLKSTCNDFRTSQLPSDCWMPKRFDKLVIIVIDALRYDFAVEVDSKNHFYENNLAVIQKHKKLRPQGSLLMKFVADPPTTTMQRLKGLTTGGLPTFIDACKNFASDQITEDNWIDQFIRKHQRIVVLGDETWGDLFPDKFHRSFLSPSFNVKDLHTVDNNIIKHLATEISKKDWEVIIAHFLGVDHCGHTFGPDTAQMESKLLQMNTVIEDTIEQMDNETLLLVFGDHGMTSTGDHGGDTLLELEAALFAYTKKDSFNNGIQASTISQIDLVPTLSLLFGVPIPFSNIGKIIENIMGSGAPENIAQAYSLNAQQVHRYLTTYQSQTNEISGDKMKLLTTAFNSFNTNINSTKAPKLAQNYLDIARSTCEESWATFDVVIMSAGILCLIFCLIATCFLKLPVVMNTSKITLLFFFFQISSILSLLVNIWFIFLIPLALVFLISDRISISQRSNNILIILTILFCSGSFSNSFLLSEASLCLFFVASIIFIEIWNCLHQKDKHSSKRSDKKVHLPQFHLLCISVISIMTLLKLSSIFWHCREEQLNCETNSFIHQPLATLPSSARNIRFFMVISLIFIYLHMVKCWLNYNGNLAHSVSYLFGGMLPILCWICIIIQWVTDTFEGLKLSLPHLYLVAWFVYGSVVGAYLYFLYNPLLIHTVDRTKQLISQANLVPHILSQMRNPSRETNDSKPMVFGLGSSFSSVFFLLGSYVMLLQFILCSDGLALSFLLLVTTSLIFLFIHSYFVLVQASSFDKLFQIKTWSVFIWFLLSIQGFYTSGHQNTFSSIRWGTAFVGFDESNQWMAALLISINTFSSHIWFAFLLPLLFIMPFSIGSLFKNLSSGPMASKLEKSEYLISQVPEKSRSSLLQLSLLYLSFHAVKLLFTCIASFSLRRHLMVWKIFAPKFVFEALGFGATCIALSLGHFLVLRLLEGYEKWNYKYTVTELVTSKDQ